MKKEIEYLWQFAYHHPLWAASVVAGILLILIGGTGALLTGGG